MLIPFPCIIGGNQLQPEQTGEIMGKWHVVGVPQTQFQTQFQTPVSAGEEDSGDEKPRTRRVACTCPNCSEGGERLVCYCATIMVYHIMCHYILFSSFVFS